MPPFLIRQLLTPNSLPHYNERRVLQVIRRLGEASKSDLARQTYLTNAAVGTVVSANYKTLIKIFIIITITCALNSLW